jgi:hydroxymethylpyrimidine/phosphomethylpyrimidine kinase
MGSVVPDRFFWALPPPEEGAEGEATGDNGPGEPDDSGTKGPSRRIH